MSDTWQRVSAQRIGTYTHSTHRMDRFSTSFSSIEVVGSSLIRPITVKSTRWKREETESFSRK